MLNSKKEKKQGTRGKWSVRSGTFSEARPFGGRKGGGLGGIREGRSSSLWKRRPTSTRNLGESEGKKGRPRWGEPSLTRK